MVRCPGAGSVAAGAANALVMLPTQPRPRGITRPTRVDESALVIVDAKKHLLLTTAVMKTTRRYTMGARADAVRETRRRILEATFALAQERLIAEISLDTVAERAGVSVQTVLRQFGSRAGLIEATVEHGSALVDQERRTPPGDVDAAVEGVVAHYERRGDATLLLLAQESGDAQVRRITQAGRTLHRSWVTEAFGPQLAAVADPTVTTDLLVVATDVYAWKLLRRDRGLTRSQTGDRMLRLVRAVLAAAEEGASS